MKLKNLQKIFVLVLSIAFSGSAFSEKCEAEKVIIPDSKNVAAMEALADAGDTHAQARLALAYVHGKGIEHDYAKGYMWLEKSAANGSSEGQYFLGMAYLQNGKTDKDFQKAADLMRQSAAQGCIAAQFNLGVIVQRGGHGIAPDPTEGMRMIRETAESGYARAQLWLGSMLITGESIEKDPVTGFHWIERAANAGESAAEGTLAGLYLGGIGTEANYEKARNLLESVYAKNDDQASMAAYMLGQMYMDGKGVPPDNAKAFRWMIIAAGSPISDAVQRLKILAERLQQDKLTTACDVYQDAQFEEHAAKVVIRADRGDKTAVLTFFGANAAEVYFPDRHLLGYISKKCMASK